MSFTRMDLFLRCTNLFVLGGLGVLMVLRGLSVPMVLLVLGALGMSVSKIGKAVGSARINLEPNACLQGCDGLVAGLIGGIAMMHKHDGQAGLFIYPDPVSFVVPDLAP